MCPIASLLHSCSAHFVSLTVTTSVNCLSACITREFFRLALADISRNNALFDGSLEKRVAGHHLVELQGMIVGRLIALSLIHGGPSPQFFARPVAEYLLGFESLTIGIQDVPDHDVQESLHRVGLHELYISFMYTFLATAGWNRS